MNQGNVLLYSPGLGYINRGGETFTRKLHKVLTQKQDLQVTLFQGAGKLIAVSYTHLTLPTNREV